MGHAMRNLILCGTALLLTGCADYMNHRDTITFGAGNAMEANKAIHVVNPFNPQSYNTKIYADGRRTAQVMRTYNGGQGGGQSSYGGNCLNPGNTASDGSNCGLRAATARPGGVE